MMPYVDMETPEVGLVRPELGPVAYDIGKDYALAALSTVLALVEDPVEVMRRVLHTIFKKRVQPEVHK